MSDHLSRRGLLNAGLGVGAAGVAGAVMATPAQADAKQAASPTLTVTTVDSVVVGAGLAGMAAARKLAAAGKNVVVLEARDRVGGRAYDVTLANGGVMEAGGQFIGPTQTSIQALATALGVQTFVGYNTGDGLFYDNGTITRFQGVLPPLDQDSLTALYTAIGTLDGLAATVPVSAPWTAPNADALDAQTVDSWIKANVSNATVQAILLLMVNGAMSAEARDMSFLWFLYYIASSGDSSNPGTLERLTGTIGGARDSRFVGGPQQICKKIATSLGSKVVLNSPVRSITQSGSTATVCTDTHAYKASSVVVALPTPLAARLQYSPALPATRDQLTQRFPLSSVGKTIAIYNKPFWRDSGLNGQAASTSGLIRSTFDNSPPNASYGALCAVLDGDAMRSCETLTDAQIKTKVLADLTNYFGAAAGTPTQFVLLRWDSEEYSRGGAPSFTPPGVLSRYGVAIRPAVGVIHWAGSETSDYWAGHMEGAVRSGERAATEIIGH